MAGVDEAGRGPLAGPVIAAAVVFFPFCELPLFKDSKQLSPKQRLHFFTLIQKEAIAFAIGRAEVHEIDSLNIHHSTLLAMQRAVLALPQLPSRIYVDGCHAPLLPSRVHTIPKGDEWMPLISAASILAKVTRDQEMLLLDREYPQYGFAHHKGYPTEAHHHALQKYGATPHHRRSFGRVRKILNMVN